MSEGAPDWDYFMPVLYTAVRHREKQRPVATKLKCLLGISMTPLSTASVASG